MKSLKQLSVIMFLIITMCTALFAGGMRDGQKEGRPHHGEEGPPPHGGQGFPLLKMLDRLDLTDSQKEQVSGILSKYRKEGERIRTNMQAAHEALASVIFENKFDEAAVRAAYKQVSSSMEDVTVLTAKMFSEIKPILTKEQLEKIKEFKHHRKEMMREGMEKREKGLDDWIKE